MNNTNRSPHASLGTVIPSADWEITTRGAPWLQRSDQIKHLNLGPWVWVSLCEQGVSAAMTVNGDAAAW